MSTAAPIVFGCAVTALLLAWMYFRRYAAPRPPVGVLGLGDVLLLLAGVVVMPYVYLALPLWLAAAVLGVGLLNVSATCLQPVLPHPGAVWLAALGLLPAPRWR